MADPIRAKADFSGWIRGLEQLAGTAKVSLARSMGVAGGQVLRDEAILLCPVGTAAGGSIRPGLLRSAIYLAYKTERSLGDQQVYAVSWNSDKAPHGHLVEFGHWQTNVTYKGDDGEWYSDPGRKLEVPKWVPAHPFLRPALDSAGSRAVAAMMKRGRERFFELLADPNAPEAGNGA